MRRRQGEAMGEIRHVTQPGPAPAERLESAAGRCVMLEFDLEPGLTLNAAVTGPLVAAGLGAAQVELAGGAFAPLAYVMPAPSPDAAHVAWYSATFTPAGTSRLERGNVTFGRRDGAPFLHCHALWTEADGRRGGGHILPHEAVVSEPIRARAFGAAEVETTADFDPETNFTLFTPHARAASDAGSRIVFARVRPNADIFAAVESLCRRHGLSAARLRGCVGSLIGARFTDAPGLEDFATEAFITDGTVAPDASGTPRADLSVALVGLSGALAEGRLARGQNAVLITFELALVEEP